MSPEITEQFFAFAVGTAFGIALSVAALLIWLEIGRREILSQYRVTKDNVGLHRRPEQEEPKQAA